MTKHKRVSYYFDSGYHFQYWYIKLTTPFLYFLRPSTHYTNVSFCSIADVGAFSYGLGHVMKPHRIKMTHSLIEAYDLLPKLNVMVSPGSGTLHRILHANIIHSILNMLRNLRKCFPFIIAGRMNSVPSQRHPNKWPNSIRTNISISSNE